ncbi:FecR family protein [Sphingobacterium sp. 1.A.4]|uniref:FecR family protein n=1 Tax=Sphingobacterium sp. 1.A.4 TaxID=2044603 RepID=UPI000C0BF26A|nr:FecR family protein [Sphingobacterium sp. 1.A.4]
MDKIRLESLIKKFLSSELSLKEEKDLIKIMTEKPNSEYQELFEEIYNKYKIEKELSEVQKQKIWSGISVGIGNNSKNWKNIFQRVAAILTLFLSVGGIYIFIFYSNLNGDPVNYSQNSITRKKLPVSIFSDNLFFGNGIELTEATLKQFGINIQNSDSIVFIDKRKDFLSLFPLNFTIKSNSSQVLSVFLSDSSKVWLNSNSSLILPNTFEKNNREVYLKGEAYFEIEHLKNKPFKVFAGDLTTEVLGTHFIVNSQSMKNTEIILLEGSVSVSNKTKKTIMSPGEIAIGNDFQIIKRESETLDLLAWKDGYFKFDNANIVEIMNQIEDWYDVKYIKIQTTNDERFSGTFKRSDQLEILLNNLEEVSNIRFRIKEGGIHVEKK